MGLTPAADLPTMTRQTMSSGLPEGAAAVPPGEITGLLQRWQAGDREAFDELAPLVYGQLKRLARASLRGAGSGTVQPTALLHELFVRLLGRPPARLDDRRHLFAFAAKALRQILVDQARARAARKRGGGAVAIDVTAAGLAASAPPAVDLLDLHRALERLAARDRELEALVELRFFGGLTLEESARALGRSAASVSRDWTLARAALYRELTRPAGAPPSAE